MSEANKIGALLWEKDGAEIVAILIETVTSAAERAGRLPDRADLFEGVGLFLSAAWQLAKLADDDADGGRSARYAEFIRKHADAVDISG